MIKDTFLFKVGVKAVVCNFNGQVLLLKRSSNQTRSGGWDLPGGALEHEEPESGLLREIFEETGLRLAEPHLVAAFYLPSSSNDNPTLQLGYRLTSQLTNVTLSDEHDESQWVTYEDLPNFNLPEKYLSLIKLARHSD